MSAANTQYGRIVLYPGFMHGALMDCLRSLNHLHTHRVLLATSSVGRPRVERASDRELEGYVCK